MKIAYYHHWGEGATSGVFKKIVSQVNAWAKRGHDVAMFNLAPTDNSTEWLIHLDPKIHFEQVIYNGFRTQVFKIPILVRRMLDWQPEIVYQRYGAYHPAYELIFRSAPVILEINSFHLNEAKFGSVQSYKYKQLTEGLMLRKVAGLIFVSNQVMNHEHYASFHALKEVIPNGIDLGLYTPFPLPQNDQPQLVFIGSPNMRFHGTDKIIFLARQFPNWNFDLIGPSSRDFDSELPDNLLAHGTLSQEDYLKFIARANIGLSSLALHNVGLYENSPLKMSEYLAWGLPVIAGYKDTNFLNGAEFILELPCSPDNVSSNLVRIQQFVESNLNKRVPREAITHIDARYKEEQRLAFFARVLEH